MGLFKHLFRHPFGGHSLFHKATQVVSILPLPGMALLGKATAFLNRAKPLGAAFQLARGFMPTPPPTAMPGGATVRAAPPSHRQHKLRFHLVTRHKVPVRLARRKRRKKGRNK